MIEIKKSYIDDGDGGGNDERERVKGEKKTNKNT